MAFKDRLMKSLKHGWNAFVNLDNRDPFQTSEISYGSRPDRTRLRVANERSIIAAIYNRIAIDVAELEIMHVRLDEKNRFSEVINSGLNDCLTVQPNIDQPPRHFRHDMTMTMFDDGTIAVVPVETS